MRIQIEIYEIFEIVWKNEKCIYELEVLIPPSPFVTPIITGTLANFPCSIKIRGFSINMGSIASLDSIVGPKNASPSINGPLSLMDQKIGGDLALKN